jgi:hypothetical protein
VTDVSLPETAVRVLHALAEAAMYVTSHGDVLAANRRRARPSARVPDGRFGRNASGPRPSCRRGRLCRDAAAMGAVHEPTPGSFTVVTPSGDETFNAKGSVIVPRAGEQPAVLLVRFWPRARPTHSSS